ncbi:MAG: hypothetical protein AB7F86_05920 [Bdellovibrionales bacterium]
MDTAEEFLKQKHLFQLGDLPTETPHPKTTQLSDWATQDIDRALATLRRVDLEALEKIARMRAELTPFFKSVSETLSAGNRVFLSGCGATGRLSLSLEYLWRRKNPGSDQVVGFMAGGDVALVHSLEGFEDFPDYGARHLMELGFTENDLLVASTEGGETPYVIGTVEKAAEVSKRKPIFLYCNSTKILQEKVDRSRRVLSHPKIDSYCLETGPMALTGSTRMQASTVLMLAIGLALEFGADTAKVFAELDRWIEYLRSVPILKLKDFIVAESATYQAGNHTIYSVTDYAITAFTDTTERAPTFNLGPFDNPKHLTDKHSLSYIMIPTAATSEEAWRTLLARAPRPLNWPEAHAKATPEYLMSFDFGLQAKDFRQTILPKSKHEVFAIEGFGPTVQFRFQGIEERFPLPGSVPLFDHLTLKLWLNMHSTLVMGRLGRFEGNLMTWVFPSNGKLIDRAARYSQILMRKMGLPESPYDDVIRAQFRAKAGLNPKESIVHRTIQELMRGQSQHSGVFAPR